MNAGISNMNTSILSDHAYPIDFCPGTNHVVIGRGKQCFKHPGNERLRLLVELYVDAYSNAETKSKKSLILAEIFQKVCKHGGFVKFDKARGLWYEVGEFLAREKISQTFRNVLHSNYKSSSMSKKKRRIEEMTLKSEQKSSHATSRVIDFDDNEDDDELALLKRDEDTEASKDDSLLFDRLSSSLSSIINEDDANPFEPVPLKGDAMEMEVLKEQHPPPTTSMVQSGPYGGCIDDTEMTDCDVNKPRSLSFTNQLPHHERNQFVTIARMA